MSKKWQPIETAPKDGTFVLLYSPDCEDGPFIGHWRDNKNFPDDGAWWEKESSFPIDADPSHWIKIPGPPRQRRAAAQAEVPLTDAEIDERERRVLDYMLNTKPEDAPRAKFVNAGRSSKT